MTGPLGQFLCGPLGGRGAEDQREEVSLEPGTEHGEQRRSGSLGYPVIMTLIMDHATWK